MAIPTPCRVLVVDDHPDTAQSTALVIELQGHQAQYLTDPTRVEERMRDFLPHVVFLDITMPGIDGWTLAKRLRGQPWDFDFKLVAVTALMTHADAYAASRRAGFDAHVAKPLDPKLLLAVLEQCFAGNG